jgi:hypothetical protein
MLDMKAMNDLVQNPIFKLLIEKLLQKSRLQHDVVVVIPPAAN